LYALLRNAGREKEFDNDALITNEVKELVDFIISETRLEMPILTAFALGLIA
jgi:hypothetical protein